MDLLDYVRKPLFSIEESLFSHELHWAL